MTSFFVNWLRFSRDASLAMLAVLFLTILCIIGAMVLILWLAFAIVAAVVSLPFFAIKKMETSIFSDKNHLVR